MIPSLIVNYKKYDSAYISKLLSQVAEYVSTIRNRSHLNIVVEEKQDSFIVCVKPNRLEWLYNDIWQYLELFRNSETDIQTIKKNLIDDIDMVRIVYNKCINDFNMVLLKTNYNTDDEPKFETKHNTYRHINILCDNLIEQVRRFK